MSVEKCVVPQCQSNATTGIPFPKQDDLKDKWLESLQIKDFQEISTSFVCLDHFRDSTGNQNKAEGLESILEELCIPTLLPQNNETLDITPQTEESVTSEHNLKVENVEHNLNTGAICRLCMSHNEADVDVDIFGNFDGEITIAIAINHCIPALKISRHDDLSKIICGRCLEMLIIYHKFRSTCLDMDFKQRETLLIKRGAKRKIVTKVLTTIKKTRQSDVSAVKIKKEFADNNLRRAKIDQKFDHVEAELMKALEGKLTEEMKDADNIIIEVQSDEESDEVVSENNVVKVGSDQIKIPRGIKVRLNAARTGPCEAQIIKGVYNSEFCLVDHYLFEYRLKKGSVRYLSCVSAKCRSTAEQTSAEKVFVKILHNHSAPTERDVKKQVFLQVLRRKMQTDKTLNFRSLYEEMCKEDPGIKNIISLKTVINEICSQQMRVKSCSINSFDGFYHLIEDDKLQKLHFTHTNKQFYQEKFTASDDSKAVIFANSEKIEEISDSKIMYVDASFKIDTKEKFEYHLLTVLVWVDDSYYPILFALVSHRSQEIYKAIFTYLQTILAPRLRPVEIVTDYEAALYYSLGETYLDSHIGGSVFYYTQNLYKKICSLNLSRELETNSCFRNIYHMILMLPLLPVNTIIDGLSNIESQANEMGQSELTTPIFEYVKSQWMAKVTPDLFCVHRLENRINENVIAPFKKLRDFLMLSKGKMQKQQVTIVSVVEKLIELEGFLQVVYSAPSKKSFARDLSSSQKKNVIRAWQFIESHPKININNFFTKVLGYIKCMENQLWIWGFYRFCGDANDELINASNFSIVNANGEEEVQEEQNDYLNYVYSDMVMDVMIDEKDGFLVKQGEEDTDQAAEQVVTTQELHEALIEAVANESL